MDGIDRMERKLRDLLDAAAGEPPHRVSVAAVRRRVTRRRAVEYVAGAAAVAVVAAFVPAGTGALGHLLRPAARPATPVVYVLIQHGQSGSGTGAVIPISTATNKPGNPIAVGRGASAIAVKPDGSTVYVANRFSGTVTPIATASGTPGKPIKVGPEPDFIAITPDGKTAYVATAGTSGLCLKPPCPPPIPASVTPISTATNTPSKPIHVRADQIVITPDGRTAYAVNLDGVIPISTATNTLGKPLTDVYQPSQLAITPDGKTAYITHPLDQVTPVDTASNTEGKPIHVVRGPGFIAFTPDSKTAYVASDGNPPNVAPSVTPISTATGTPGVPISVGVSGRGSANYAQIQLAITPDGKTVYLDKWLSGSDTVLPISTATNTAGKLIHIGAAPVTSWFSPQSYIVFTRDGKTAYVAGLHSVTPVSTATSTAGPPIPVGTGWVGGMAITP